MSVRLWCPCPCPCPLAVPPAGCPNPAATSPRPCLGPLMQLEILARSPRSYFGSLDPNLSNKASPGGKHPGAEAGKEMGNRERFYCTTPSDHSKTLWQTEMQILPWGEGIHTKAAWGAAEIREQSSQRDSRACCPCPWCWHCSSPRGSSGHNFGTWFSAAHSRFPSDVGKPRFPLLWALAGLRPSAVPSLGALGSALMPFLQLGRAAVAFPSSVGPARRQIWDGLGWSTALYGHWDTPALMVFIHNPPWTTEESWILPPSPAAALGRAMARTNSCHSIPSSCGSHQHLWDTQASLVQEMQLGQRALAALLQCWCSCCAQDSGTRQRM